MVNAISGHELLGFMDAYYGYNQIRMDEIDTSDTTFYVYIDIYHYTIMPFGLINIGATYQMMVM